MQIETLRFGRVEIDAHKILTFDQGLPGLESSRRFTLLHLEAGNPILWLQSVDAPEICLPVVDSFAAVPDYVFDLFDEDVAALGLDSPADLYVLSVLVIPQEIQGMTANLAAPVVINMRTGQARQVVLGGQEHPVRLPIFRRICEMMKEDERDAGAKPEN